MGRDYHKIQIYFSKVVSLNPKVGDYVVVNGYNTLKNNECSISIGNMQQNILNSGSAIVHILPGKTKSYMLSIRNYEYEYNGQTYTLEANFEFNP